MCCELGIQGAAIYLSLFFILLLMLTRLVLKIKSHNAYFMLITLIAYLMIAFFDFPLERIEHQVLSAVLISISMFEYDSASQKRKAVRPIRFAFLYFAIICFSLTVCYYRLKGEYYTRQLILLDKVKHSKLVVSKCDKAKSMFYTIDPLSCPLEWHAGLALLNENKIKQARARLEAALKTTPYNVLVIKDLILIYIKEGDLDKANTYLKLAYQISPKATEDLIKKKLF
jgi:tetratricopeptide (TPR) repeat protein